MCSLDVYDQGLMLQSIEEGKNTWLGTLFYRLTLILVHIHLKNTWLDTLFYRL
jgi:hypothetical protein